MSLNNIERTRQQLDNFVSEIELQIDVDSRIGPAERRSAVRDSLQTVLKDTFKLVKAELNNALELLQNSVRSFRTTILIY